MAVYQAVQILIFIHNIFNLHDTDVIRPSSIKGNWWY